MVLIRWLAAPSLRKTVREGLLEQLNDFESLASADN